MRGSTVYSAAGCFPSYAAQLPLLQVFVNNASAKALLDTGCSKTIVSRELVNNCQLRPVFRSVILMNSEEVDCSESCMCEVVVDGRCVMLDCIISNVTPGFGVLLGMDAINRLGLATRTRM